MYIYFNTFFSAALCLLNASTTHFIQSTKIFSFADNLSYFGPRVMNIQEVNGIKNELENALIVTAYA